MLNFIHLQVLHGLHVCSWEIRRENRKKRVEGGLEKVSETQRGQ